MRRERLLGFTIGFLIGLIVGLPIVVWATQVTVPYTFQSGGRIEAQQLNSNFRALSNGINSFDGGNLAAGSINGDHLAASVAGNGLVKDTAASPDELDVQVDNMSLEINSDTLRIRQPISRDIGFFLSNGICLDNTSTCDPTAASKLYGGGDLVRMNSTGNIHNHVDVDGTAIGTARYNIYDGSGTSIPMTSIVRNSMRLGPDGTVLSPTSAGGFYYMPVMITTPVGFPSDFSYGIPLVVDAAHYMAYWKINGADEPSDTDGHVLGSAWYGRAISPVRARYHRFVSQIITNDNTCSGTLQVLNIDVKDLDAPGTDRYSHVPALGVAPTGYRFTADRDMTLRVSVFASSFTFFDIADTESSCVELYIQIYSLTGSLKESINIDRQGFENNGITGRLRIDPVGNGSDIIVMSQGDFFQIMLKQGETGAGSRSWCNSSEIPCRLTVEEL